MFRDVRTTVRIDDDLCRQVKQRAAHEGRTAAAVLEDAVRTGMARSVTERTPVASLTTVGGSTNPRQFERTNAQWQDLLDDGLSTEKLR